MAAAKKPAAASRKKGLDIPAALTRKLGPLPAWAWLGIATVGIVIWRMHQSSSSSASVGIPTPGTAPYSSAGYGAVDTSGSGGSGGTSADTGTAQTFDPNQLASDLASLLASDLAGLIQPGTSAPGGSSTGTGGGGGFAGSGGILGGSGVAPPPGTQTVITTGTGQPLNVVTTKGGSTLVGPDAKGAYVAPTSTGKKVSVAAAAPSNVARVTAPSSAPANTIPAGATSAYIGGAPSGNQEHPNTKLVASEGAAMNKVTTHGRVVE